MSVSVRGTSPEKTHPGLQYFRDSFKLIGNRCDDEIGFCGDNLLRLCRPGICDYDARAICHLRTDVGTVFGAGDKPVEQSEIT